MRNGSGINTPILLVGGVFTFIGSLFAVIGTAFLFFSGDFSIEGGQLFLPILFIAMGLLFAVIGIALLNVLRRKRRKIRRLRDTGTAYPAKVVRAYYDNSVSVNNTPGLVLECEYMDRYGTAHLVKSDRLWSYVMHATTDDYKVQVWVDPQDDKNYLVEVLEDVSGSLNRIQDDR